MAKERDYKREQANRDKSKENTINIGLNVPKTLNEDFTAKVELENTTKSAKIKELISNYTYGEKSSN